MEEAIRRGRVEEPGTRDPAALLRGFGLLGDSHVLRAGALLFGHRERLMSDYPQCLLRLARFRGTTRSEFIDNQQRHGNIFALLHQAQRYLIESLPVAGRIAPGVLE